MSVMSKAPNPEKGRRYLAQLDQALCDGSWEEVPELARKTDKHAPERQCLTLAARIQVQIEAASHRPTSASSGGTASIHSLGEAVPKLQEAITSGKSPAEDTYCASVCLAEIQWLQAEPHAALRTLPDSGAFSGTARGPVGALGWLEVCEVKARYLKLAALEATGREEDVGILCRTAVAQTPGSRTPELRRWTEQLLARACTHVFKKTQVPSLPALNDALLSFRAWASFWQRASSASGGSSISSSAGTPRRQVWRAYYEVLSMVLRLGLMYNPSANATSNLLVVPWNQLSDNAYLEARIRQRRELKTVETTYETLLIDETHFPKASETNSEVEEWVEQAIDNWKILCGAGWTDAELGEGGKEVVGRSMLDILYRAATKTFHSTAILRQLFVVHAALGQFDLALHAFDSYVEIVSKGKAREEKTGQHELGFDSEDTAVLTVAAALQVLCKYGDHEQGEKAMAVGNTLRQWLVQHRPTSQDEVEKSADNKVPDPPSKRNPTHSQVQLSTLAAAHRAMGIVQAHWARLTYDADSMNAIRVEALANLQRAYSYDQQSVETAYTLARLLAETREVSAAIQIIQQCIAVQQSVDGDAMEGGEYDRQKRLIPIWHLLSLCLTAKDDYDSAIQMCGAAYEQFGDAHVLFGRTSDQASPPTATRVRSSAGLVDSMDNLERETVLQVKMSQLTLLELTEGAEAAVGLGDELLGLYTRLFGSPQQLKVPSDPPPTTAAPPQSRSGGTFRSIAGSIRPRSRRRTLEKDTFQASPTASSPALRTDSGSDLNTASPNGQTVGAPISITVTNEDGSPAAKGPSHEHHHHHHHHHHLHLPFHARRHQGHAQQPDGPRSTRSRETLDEKLATETNGTPPPNDLQATDPRQSGAPSSTSSELGITPRQPLGEMQHNETPQHLPMPLAHGDQPPEQDLRLPVPVPAAESSPLPSFGSLQERQHKTSILVNVWLFIAGLYVRADLYNDAEGAISEAYTLVQIFEADKNAYHANAKRLFEKGWGAGKSVDELWADVYAAKGDLACARNEPYRATEHYEEALLHFPDHPEAIIGTSNILMDIYEEKIPAEEPEPLLRPAPDSSGTMINDPALLAGSNLRPATAKSSMANTGRAVPPAVRHNDPTPAQLNRLAARDRAYMLLANLTKLGSGWDNSEAWYTLARAHELSKQLGKAKQALWWVVELEDNKPMRPFSVTSAGGYAL